MHLCVNFMRPVSLGRNRTSFGASESTADDEAFVIGIRRFILLCSPFPIFGLVLALAEAIMERGRMYSQMEVPV